MGNWKGVQGTCLVAKGKKPLGKALVLKAVTFYQRNAAVFPEDLRILTVLSCLELWCLEVAIL